MKQKLKKRTIQTLAMDLRTAFIWRDTPQGHDYWKGVFDNLMSLALNAKDEDEDDAA